MKNVLSDSRVQYFSVLVSNVLVMGLGFMINIIATRIMGSEELGYYKAFINSLMVLFSFSNFGFHYTFSRLFALNDEKLNSRSLNSSAIIIYISINIIIFIMIQSFLVFAHYFNIVLPNYFVIASSFFSVQLFYFYIQQKLQGENRMFSYSMLAILPQFFLSIFFVYNYFIDRKITSNAAILMYMIANVCVILFYLVEAGFSLSTGIHSFKNILKKNFNYGFHLYFGSLLNVFVGQVMNLMIASLSGLSEYANLMLGISFASPLAMVPSTMGIVKFSKNVRGAKLTKKDIFAMVGITIVAIIIYREVLNRILIRIIGNDYVGAISYANDFVFYFAIMGIGDYFNKILCAKGYGKTIRNGAIVSGIALIFVAALMIPRYAVNGLIYARTVSAIIYMLFMILFYVKKRRKE